MLIPDFSILTWITLFSLLGGLLSVVGAALVALNVSKAAVPMLISYAIGAMLGAVFLEILPEAINAGNNTQAITGTVLIGILLFFCIRKIGDLATLSWRPLRGSRAA